MAEQKLPKLDIYQSIRLRSCNCKRGRLLTWTGEIAGEARRPWKLSTFSVGLLILIIGSFYYQAPDWDIPVSIIMATFTYIFSGWSMRVMFERRWRHWPAMLFLTWWCVDGCYALYWHFVDPVALDLMREANAPASLSLFWMCGLLWSFNGSLREAISGLKKVLDNRTTIS